MHRPPSLIPYKTADGSKATLIGACQQSGICCALDPDTGALIWRTKLGPGSALGGMEWGSASDGDRIYVSLANFYGIPTNVGGAGSWAALDSATGTILRQTGDPNGAVALGPVTVSGDAAYVSSMAGNPGAPTVLALDAVTGQIIWSYAAGSSVNAGASIVNGVVHWCSGYAQLGIPGWSTNNKFYAFSVRGR